MIGGGWSGCAAALTARKAGAEVLLLEKTDLLAGAWKRRRDHAQQRTIHSRRGEYSDGGGRSVQDTDSCSRHINIDFPGHKHASLYDVTLVEPHVRRLLREKGVDLRFMREPSMSPCAKMTVRR